MAESARLKNLGGVVRAGEIYQGKQGPDYAPGVSAETAGSRALWLGSVTLPPGGGRTKAHIHEDHESAFYMISGEEVEVYTGERLEHRDVAHAGDVHGAVSAAHAFGLHDEAGDLGGAQIHGGDQRRARAVEHLQTVTRLGITRSAAVFEPGHEASF